MIELLFLLLPIAAAYGYYMGRSSVSNKNQDSKSKKTTDYLRGVEYLLNNEKERAVDKFIDYLNDADPSFETSLALGNLFRKRGEFDKAISLHEKLSENKDYDEAQNEISRMELARDFLGAGLIDRAEDILSQLVDIPRQRVRAARLLITLYEHESDYLKAIEYANRFKDALDAKGLVALSNYYCQKAKQDFAASLYDKAIASLNEALVIDTNSIRARVGLAEIYVKQGRVKEAVDLAIAISEIDSDSGMFSLAILKKCFANKADPAYRIVLEDLVRRTQSSEAIVELVEVIEITSSIKDAKLLLVSSIKEKPNLKLFSALMRLSSKDNSPQATESILQLKSLVDAQIVSSTRFCCYRCGFESKMMFYQCPSCRRWNTLKAIRGLTGD